MSPTLLAVLEVGLLAGGALAARAFTRWIGREAERVAVLMAGVTAWLILFGILPFMVFAIYARSVGRSGGAPDGWEVLVLNLIPFALVTAPVVGFVHGLRVSARREADRTAP
ncbi:MAG: hypothetical protein ACRDJ4_08420 [Actinomycetota bacterium]